MVKSISKNPNKMKKILKMCLKIKHEENEKIIDIVELGLIAKNN